MAQTRLTPETIKFLSWKSQTLEGQLTLLNELADFEWVNDKVNVAEFFEDLLKVRFYWGNKYLGIDYQSDIKNKFHVHARTIADRLIVEIQDNLFDSQNSASEYLQVMLDKSYGYDGRHRNYMLNV